MKRLFYFCLSSALLILLSLGVFAKPVTLAGNALIYRGPGACRGCPEAVGTILTKMGYKIFFVSPGQLNEKFFATAAMYVQPGGTDDIDETLNALKPGEIENLRRFIARGGRYLGICAGGYLAGRYSDAGKKHPAFGLVPIDLINEESHTAKAKVTPVKWLQQLRALYFQAGPSFGYFPFYGAQVIARYQQSGNIAALTSSFGLGRVGLIGPHPEADESWYEDDKLTPDQGYNFDLLEDFVERLQLN